MQWTSETSFAIWHTMTNSSSMQGFKPSTSFSDGVQSTFEPPVSLHDLSQIDIRLYVRIHTWEILTRTRKQHPSQGDDASTAGVAPGRVGRDEHGDARRANTAPNVGPHLELERLRLKTWSKSDFSIAETTWSTYLCIYLLSETNRKTERKARFNLVHSTNSPIQPNKKTTQCARCLFSESLAHTMFLLAVSSRNQIVF